MPLCTNPPAAFTIIVALSASTAAAQPAGAPPQSAPRFEPFLAATTRDATEIRAGAGIFYYPVASVPTGTRVSVVGEDSGFYRVQFPAGQSSPLRACIRVDDGAAEGGNVRLSRAARLMHFNLGQGVPFCPITFDKDPAAGATFKLLDTLKGGDGRPLYYVIPAPEGASAYVNKEQVRRLTAEEAAAAAPIPPAPPAGAPAGTSGAPAETPPAAPAEAIATPSSPSTAGPAPVAPVRVDPRTAEIDALVEAFKRVQAQPLDQAELEPAIAQFNAAIGRLGSSPADQRLAQRLGSYVEVMRLRLDLRAAMANAATTVNDAEERIVEVRRQLANIERQGFFKVIGRLLPSTVYDGARLPKLFRVVSPEPGASRTLAYILPQPGLDLEGKLGRIVGVAGDSRMDESLKANLVTPKRVEVLNLTLEGGASESR